MFQPLIPEKFNSKLDDLEVVDSPAFNPVLGNRLLVEDPMFGGLIRCASMRGLPCNFFRNRSGVGESVWAYPVTRFKKSE